MLPWYWKWIDNWNGIIIVIEWSFLFVMLLYSRLRLKRNDWALAFLMGLIFMTINAMNLFRGNNSVGWVPELFGGQ